MNWQSTILVIITTTVVSIATVSLLFTWQQRRMPGFWAFYSLAAATAWWVCTDTIEKLTFNLPDKIFWAKFQYLGIATIGLFWLMFTLEYSRQKSFAHGLPWLTLWIIPIAAIILVFTNEYHHLIWTDIRLLPVGNIMGAVYDHGFAFFVLWIYDYMLLFAGVIVLATRLRGQSRLFINQYLNIMLSLLAPLIANSLYVIGHSPIPGMDLTPQAMVISCIVMAWSIWRFHMLDVLPIAREAILDRLADGVLIVDNNQRVVEINPRAEQILNLKRAQVLGAPIRHALKRWPNITDPCKPNQDVTLNLTPAAYPSVDRGESQITRPIRDYQLRSTPLLDDKAKPLGYFLILHDITEQLLAEEHRRLQSVALEAVANGIVITDNNGAIQWVNPAFTQITGYALDDVLGQNPRILKSNVHDLAFYENMWQTILAGEVWHGELLNRRADGRFYDEEMTIAPVRADGGEIVNFVAIKQDITARKRAEAALSQSNAEKQRLVEAEAILTERNRIAQEIHDGLAQNLAALRMRMNRWRKLAESNPVGIKFELDEADQIVSASLQEARRSIFALRPLALETRGLYGALQQFVIGHGDYYDLKIHLSIPSNDSPGGLTRVTELTLFRIIQESINNAVKHAHAQNAWINLTKDDDLNLVHLTIRDDGVGFDPATLAEAEVNGHFGLRAMQERVQSAGGTWKIQSELNKGVYLDIQLPLRSTPKER